MVLFFVIEIHIPQFESWLKEASVKEEVPHKVHSHGYWFWIDYRTCLCISSPFL